MQKIEFFKTGVQVKSENYPYGYKLKTDKFDWTEFHPKKGYRHCSQTINPKTGRANAVKKSTYYKAMFLYHDEKNHIKAVGLDFYKQEDTIKMLRLLHENFSILTPAEVEYFYLQTVAAIKLEAYSLATYCGADAKQVMEILTPALNTAVQGAKSKGTENRFLEILQSWDFEALENTKVPDFNPFVKSEPVNILSMVR